MSTLLVVFLPRETAERLLTEACAVAGYEPADRQLRRSQERRLDLDLRLYEHGVVLSGHVDPSVLRALGPRVAAAGAALLVIESDPDATWITEWDEGGQARREVRNPDWADGERRREEPGARIAAWQLEELAETRLGGRRSGGGLRAFRAPAPTPLAELLGAMDAGAEVHEVAMTGKVGFRFSAGGVVRTVFLSPDETAIARARRTG